MNARGTYYWDVYGVGSIGLEARDLRLAPAVIGGEGSSGLMQLENTSAGVIDILGIAVNGGNGEILEDPSNPWPVLPISLQPGETLHLGLALAPDPSGTPGERTATVEVTIRGGDLAIASVSGYAGTRTLAVNPPNLFTTTIVGIGEVARARVGLTNSGTLPVRLDNPTISGTNATNYEVQPLMRRVLEPGQTEIIEVTFSPSASGPSSGILTFGGNSTNGAQVVTLGGEAFGTIRSGDPSESSRDDGLPGTLARTGADRGANLLLAPAPNPTNGTATISYRLATTAPATVAIYDAAGRLVFEVASHNGQQGDFVETVDLTGIPIGQYFIRMETGGEVSVLPLTLTR